MISCNPGDYRFRPHWPLIAIDFIFFLFYLLLVSWMTFYFDSGFPAAFFSYGFFLVYTGFFLAVTKWIPAPIRPVKYLTPIALSFVLSFPASSTADLFQFMELSSRGENVRKFARADLLTGAMGAHEFSETVTHNPAKKGGQVTRSTYTYRFEAYPAGNPDGTSGAAQWFICVSVPRQAGDWLRVGLEYDIERCRNNLGHETVTGIRYRAHPERVKSAIAASPRPAASGMLPEAYLPVTSVDAEREILALRALLLVAAVSVVFLASSLLNFVERKRDGP
mgnify:CR=1 FL=1